MLKVKRLHPDGRLPTVTHAGSDIGFDLYALEDAVLQPGVPVKLRTGIAVEGPPGYGFVLGDRSSLAARGITYMGGRIDAGYRGEILVCLVNTNQPEYSIETLRTADGCITEVVLRKTDCSVHISKGDKIVQMSPIQATTEWEIVEADALTETSRNTRGFGSSGR